MDTIVPQNTKETEELSQREIFNTLWMLAGKPPQKSMKSVEKHFAFCVAVPQCHANCAQYLLYCRLYTAVSLQEYSILHCLVLTCASTKHDSFECHRQLNFTTRKKKGFSKVWYSMFCYPRSFFISLTAICNLFWSYIYNNSLFSMKQTPFSKYFNPLHLADCWGILASLYMHIYFFIISKGGMITATNNQCPYRHVSFVQR